MVPDRMRCALKAVWGFHVGFTFRYLPLFLMSFLQEKERTNLRGGGGFPPKIYIFLVQLTVQPLPPSPAVVGQVARSRVQMPG